MMANDSSVIASASPKDVAAMAVGLGDLGFLLSSLLTGVVNLLTNVLQLVVGVLINTIPDLPGLVGLPGLGDLANW